MSVSNALVRSTPEAQGIPSSAILAFIEETERQKLELHSLMLLRHGRVIAEGWWAPYTPERPHMLYSLSKSFTSTAVGLAVAEGRLTVDDPVLAFFPEDAPKRPSANLKALRVRHLLSMATGHDKDTTGFMRRSKDGNWARAFLARPVTHVPGTHFLYNTGATYMLSAIVQRQTGQTLLEYLEPRLFEPLSIEGATWESCPRGINTGGYGLSIKTEDVARFGQLYLRQGMWRGQRILPETWIAEATALQVSNGSEPESDWEQGYGYQFWRCRHNAYRADGAFGQFGIVMPDQDAVIAITAGVNNMQKVLDLAWQHLLPAMDRYPLLDDPESQAMLSAKVRQLALLPPGGTETSPRAAQVSGRVFRFDPNRQGITSVRLDFGNSETVVSTNDGQREHRLVCGYGAWRMGATALGATNAQLSAVATAGAWTSPDTYTAQIRFIETPHCTTLTYRFADATLTYQAQHNVAFGPTRGPRLVGRAGPA